MNKKYSRPLRVAVIGSGYFSRFHYAAWKRMPDVKLVGMLTLDSTNVNIFQKEYGVSTVYPDLSAMLEQSGADLVDIVSPPHTHADFIYQCVDAGAAVVCQKPFCSTPDEATAVINATKHKHAFIAVHENFRFQPWYRHIKQFIDNGTLGDIYEISFNFRPGDGQGANAYLDRQPYFQTQDRFFIRETGVHFIDVFRYLLGDIRGVFARLDKLNPVISGEDAGLVVFEFINGIRGVLNGNRLSDHAAVNTRLTMGELRIDGSKSVLTLNGDGEIFTRQLGSTEWVQYQFDWQDIDFGGDCVYQTSRHIAEHLLDGTPVQNLADEYVVNRYIEDAIYASAEQGRWIEI